MGNADDEVKAAATDVCAPVSEDGVAVWIEKNLLGKGGVSC
jgi:hydroxymethylpyrimidine pyrophosphatase-like HAD family hydrolase